MKKTFLTSALIAASLVPVAASAQDHRWENRGDRDRREWRQDRRENWQGWRESHRDFYRRGNWRAPFAYRSFDIGMMVPRAYWAPEYYVNNWDYYRLPAPGYRWYRYVRHYDDLLLINTRNGRVIRVYRNFYW